MFWMKPVSLKLRKIVCLLLAAQFLLGLGIVFMLPPFEGTDETAHFSRLQSEAFFPQTSLATAQSPRDNSAAFSISTDVLDYYRHGPMPYGWIHFPPMHEHDPVRIFYTYDEFFKNQPLMDGYAKSYRQTPLAAAYVPGPEPNWEGQHPGFYYLLLSKVMKLLAGHASLVTTLTVLRLFSFVLAFSGFCIGLWGTWIHGQKIGWPNYAIILTLGLLYPFLMPEYAWEFARLGNDSLCLFLFGIIWFMTLWLMRDPRSDAWLFLGLGLGFSCFAKALMMPVAFGILGFLFFEGLRASFSKKPQHPGVWPSFIKATALFLLMVMPVYVIRYLSHGTVGANEFTYALQQPDALSIMREHLTWQYIRPGLEQIFYILVWMSATGSALVVDLPMHKFLYGFSLVVLASYLLALVRDRRSFLCLPFWVMGPVLCGLFAHIIVAHVSGGTFTPGWYLHALAPAFMLIYGLGLHLLTSRAWLKPIFFCLSAVIIGLNFIIVWAHMAVFSACAVPKARGDLVYWIAPQDLFACAGQFNLVMDRLGVLAWPYMALSGFGLALLCLMAAAFIACRNQPRVIVLPASL